MSMVQEKVQESLSFVVTLLLVILIVFVFLFNRIVVFVDSGEAGVLYRVFFGGTVTTQVYGEGIQLLWPWDTMHIYNARVQEYPHEFVVLTKNGLKVTLDLSIRYRPEYKLIGVLHQQVGEDYVDIVVVPEIENVLRVLIGKLDAEEIYTTQQSLVEKAISEAIEKIAQRYVKVDNVIIKKMILPDSVAESVRKKIEQKHIADSYEYRIERAKQEKKRKKIEAEGLERFNRALSPAVLHYMGIEATLSLAKSKNAKVVVVGGGQEGGFPIIGNMPLDIFSPTQPVDTVSKSSEKDNTEVTKPVLETVPDFRPPESIEAAQ